LTELHGQSCLVAASPMPGPLNPRPSPNPPSLHLSDSDVDMPPALILPAASAPSGGLPQHSIPPAQSPGHLAIDVIVTAMPPDQPPLPPIYGDRSPASSSGSSSSLSMKSAPLLNIQYERAFDRYLSGDLHVEDPLALESSKSRWTCW